MVHVIDAPVPGGEYTGTALMVSSNVVMVPVNTESRVAVAGQGGGAKLSLSAQLLVTVAIPIDGLSANVRNTLEKALKNQEVAHIFAVVRGVQVFPISHKISVSPGEKGGE